MGIAIKTLQSVVAMQPCFEAGGGGGHQQGARSTLNPRAA